MDLFLKIPHWGLFLLLMGLLVLGFPFTIFGVFLGNPLFISLIYLLFLVVPSILFICWLFAMGRMLYTHLETSDRQGLKTSLKLFKFNFFFGLCYIILVYSFTYVFFDSQLLSSVLFLPIHFYAIFCLFYGFYYVSRNLAMAEEKGANLGDYIGYFFLILLFPVGVWIIQPKINTLYED